MMRRFGKILTGALVTATVVLSMVTSALADGTITLSGDRETGAVGDTYTVTVAAESPDGAAIAPDIQITYDPNRLSFVDCSASYGGGGGGLISITDSSATISFTVLSGGEASVDATAVFDGDGANPQTASAMIFVEGEDTAANMDAAPVNDLGLDAGTVASADGTKYVSTVFANEFMPVGFYKTNVSYEEQMVEAAQFDMGNIILLYVTDADGNNGNFDIYNPETGELTDFLQLSGIENRFIIALKADESVAVPEGVTKATLQWNEQVLEAYAFNEEVNENGVSSNEFFLIYAVSSEGNKGFYLYDQNEGTYQRYLGGMHGTGGKSNSESTGGLFSGAVNAVSSDSNEGIPLWMLIAGIVLAVLCVGLLIAVVIMGIKLKDFNSYEYIDEDEDEEEITIASKPGRKAAPESNESYLERLAKAQEEDSNPLASKAYRSGKASEEDDLETVDLESEEKEQEEASEEVTVKKRPETIVKKQPAIVEETELEEITIEPEKKKVTASDLAAKAMNDVADEPEKAEEPDELPDEMPKSVNIYEKYRMEDEKAQVAPAEEALEEEEVLDRKERMRRAAMELEDDEPRGFFGKKKDRFENFEDDEDDELEDEDDFEDDYVRRKPRMTREAKKAAKAEEKARKKAEKRMKKEYGEFGPANFAQWQEAVRDDRKIDDLESAPTLDQFMGGAPELEPAPKKKAKSQRDERFDELENEGFTVRRKSKPRRDEFEDDYEDNVRRKQSRQERYERDMEEPDSYGFSEVPVKENPQDMMRKLPANDYNKPVQPKPVQQFDFDDDFEFEFLSLDDED